MTDSGFWSEVTDSEEMKAYIKKLNKLDYKYILAFAMFAAYVLVSFISKGEGEALSFRFSDVTSDIKNVIIGIAIIVAMLLVSIMALRRREEKPIDGFVDHISKGLAPDPKTPGMMIRGNKVPKYDIRFTGDNGKTYMMSTLDKRLADCYHPGDKARYHETLQFIEKYNKDEDEYVFCPYCKKPVDPEAKNCDRCNCPILG